MKTEYRLLEKDECNIDSSFWNHYINLVRENVIPYQWDILNDNINDTEPSHAIDNFRIAAGDMKGRFYGQVFQDSDVYKWIEAVANTLMSGRDEELEEKADSIIDIIARAQNEDGYLDTYFQIEEPEKKWTDVLECHELYCAGHFIEAATAYYRATGKRKIYDTALRLADHIDSVFGPGENKLNGYPGHQEIELALLKLYNMSGEDRYLRLSKFFIDTRGTNSFFEEEFLKRNKICFWSKGKEKNPNRYYNQFPYSYYNQFHLPVRQQKTAVGHAVRGVYMYTAMAEIAAVTGDKNLLASCESIWENITKTQMYITGGIGSTHSGEAFTASFDIPNDTNYSETCASIGLIFFAQRMLLSRADTCFCDVMETAIYNTVLGGMNYQGNRFFYVNPMEVVPEMVRDNTERNHIKPVRQKWFACACCPPNIARLIGNLWQYIYTVSEDTIYTNMYISGERQIRFDDKNVELSTDTDYPWDGIVNLKVLSHAERDVKLALRIPSWCDEYNLSEDNILMDLKPEKDGYIRIKLVPEKTMNIKLSLFIRPRIMQADRRIHYNAGRVALMRGPLVYCLEEKDNGKYLSELSLNTEALKEDNAVSQKKKHDSECGKYVELIVKGIRDKGGQNGEPYEEYKENREHVELRMIPYFLWNNRGDGEMKVWMRIS